MQNGILTNILSFMCSISTLAEIDIILQWLMHQPSMKQIMAEREAAIYERNLVSSEKKAALVDRDISCSAMQYKDC
ncbi:hypothetical protein V6N13_143903 [Hibiscus sabdariffa]